MNLPATGGSLAAARDVLSAILGRVLGRDAVDADGDLFALGGGWFEAATVSRLVQDAFEVRLPPDELATAPSPAGLAELVERHRGTGTGAGERRAAPVAISQLGMLWHERLAPGSFNLAPFVRRLYGPLDAGALAASFEQLIDRHEPLRTTFEVRDGRPVQIVGGPPGHVLPVRDLSDRAQASAEAAARELVAEAGGEALELGAGPLFEPRLVRLGAEDHLLVVRLHHTVFDDWSLGVYRRELSTLYGGLRDGDPARLPELPLTFGEYAREQRRRLAGAAGAGELAWWRAQLAGAPWTTQLAIGDPSGRPVGPSDPVQLILEPELAGRLRALARHARVTPFMLLLAGFQLLLHRHTGQDDMLIASVVTGRDGGAVDGLIGCFTKKVPLRLRHRGNPSFLDLLGEVRDVLLATLAHQELGFEEVLQEVLGADAARHGLVPHLPIMFQGVVPAATRLGLPGVTGGPFGTTEQGPGRHVVAGPAAEEPSAPAWGDGMYPRTFLGLSVVDDGTELGVRAQGGFYGPAVRTLLDEFRDLLADAARRPLVPVDELAGARADGGPPRRFRGFALNRPRWEQAIAGCPGVREASLDTPADGTRLVARVVPETGAAPDLPTVRDHLWRALPGAPWPAELVMDGSTKRRRGPERPDPVESRLAAIWAARLGVPDVGGEANYWQSFPFLDVVATARAAGMLITPEQVARNRTLRTLAADLTASAPTGKPPGEVIRVRALSKRYSGGIRAVDALDLSVHQGEVFGLLGPNGAGKTTTVGMLTTLILPTGGQALVDGVDVVADPAMAKQSIGVVPQVNDLDSGLTVFENLYFHGRYFGMGAGPAQVAARRMLRRFRLADRGPDKVESLSGGMVRRLQLARALMHGPAVAFLDEPTAGLDPQSRLALWDMVAELKVEGQTVLLTTHYMEEADRFCDRVAIMDHGRILAVDTPEGLKHSLGSSGFVLLRADGELDGLAARLAELDWVHEAVPVSGGLRVTYGERGALSSVLALAERSGVRVTDVSLGENSLETVFLNLTGRELRE